MRARGELEIKPCEGGKDRKRFDAYLYSKKPLPDTGYISLQDHGLHLFFRNLGLKELD